MLDGMNQSIQNLPTFPLLARRVAAFCLTFVAGLFGWPLVAIAAHSWLPSGVGNFLFSWPQLALAPFGFTVHAGDGTLPYLGDGWSYALTGAFWLLVGLALSWLLRKQAVRVTVLATLPVAFAVAIAALAMLDYFDVGIYLDDP
jgi:hypothetical protein